MASLFSRLSRTSMSGPISHLPVRPSLVQTSSVMKQIRALHAGPSFLPPFTSTRLTPQRPRLPQASAIQHQVRTVISTTPFRPPPSKSLNATTAREKIDEIHEFAARFEANFQDMEAAKLDLEMIKLDIATLNRKTSDLITFEQKVFRKPQKSDAIWGGDLRDTESAKLDLKSIKLDIAALNQKTSDLITEQKAFNKRMIRETTRSKASGLTEGPGYYDSFAKETVTESQKDPCSMKQPFHASNTNWYLIAFKAHREPVGEKIKKDEPKPAQSEPESRLGKKIVLPGFN
ncbi:hypothetical protein DER45DRAFT_553936 [Fusarium avenaceum]|nr:hypothetical protein DER45DRAFT_553936 [Fusarium avenaceum]